VKARQRPLSDFSDFIAPLRVFAPKRRICGEHALKQIAGIVISFRERILSQVIERERNQVRQPDALANHDAQISDRELT
jgi:hypothetical protein